MKTLIKVMTVSVLFALTLTESRAQSYITVNLNSVNVTSGAGVDATSLLESYGITPTNVSPAGDLLILSDNFQSYEVPSPGPNYLSLQNNSQPNTYTLNFAFALDGFSFTRIGQTTNGNLGAEWTATAYSGTVALSSVGEAFGAIPTASHDYALTGSDITSVVFTADGFGVAGIPSAPIDNIVMEVPEPSTWAMMLGGLGLLLYWGRQGRSARV